MRLPISNISLKIAPIYHHSSTSIAYIAVSVSNEAVSRRGQSLGGESCAPEDMIGISEETALSCDWNAM